MNGQKHNEIVNFIWSIADDVLRDVFVRGKYRDIILPFTVLRRLDALLEPTKKEVLKTYEFLKKQKIDDYEGLTDQTGYPFYNISPFTLRSLLDDPDHIDSNLKMYLNGFDPFVQKIVSKFKIRNQLETLEEANLTYHLVEKFTSRSINLSPNSVIGANGEKIPGLTNLGMGYVFEELIRKFNEENNEEAGEHFTPRDIIRLMTRLTFEPVKDQLKEKATYLVYDPACGTGGMLTESQKLVEEMFGKNIQTYLYGQEVNPETYAICTADMLIKGEDPENIFFGSTLSTDGFPDKRFDFMLTNPPYGKSWQKDKADIVGSGGRVRDPRFVHGIPRVSDGQLLFLANMVSKMKHDTDLGSRIASVHNGSALFTGDAGQGESDIRKWIIENDYLEAIIALPERMFYNTGIATYVFILTNRKQEHKRGKIQLIDSTKLYADMRKNLGNKSREQKEEHINKILKLFTEFKETATSKIFENSEFGYQQIIVERPLRLKASLTKENIEKVKFNVNTLAEIMRWMLEKFGDAVYQSPKEFKTQTEKYLENNNISLSSALKTKLFSKKFWQEQRELFSIAQEVQKKLGEKEYKNFNKFTTDFENALTELNVKTTASQRNNIYSAVSEKSEGADPVIKKQNKDGSIEYEPDSDLRDKENVPLKENIEEYFEREVLPYVSDAWIDHSKTKIGYEINFNKYFYEYKPLRDLADIKADILKLEKETDGLLEKILDI